MRDNPFAYDTPVGRYEFMKMVFHTVTLIAPVRLLLFLVLVVVAFVLAFIATIGMTSEAVYDNPLPRWRRAVLTPIPYICRVGLYIFGFYHIEVKGKLDHRACLITPNHVSLFDLLLMYWLVCPSALSKAEAFNIPVISTIFKALQVIPVQRLNTQSKKEATELIYKFASTRVDLSKSERFPPVLIFPQGTTTKQSHITMFQRGAFTPGLAIQPIGIFYEYKHFNPAFVVNRKTDWFLFRHLCQFSMSVTINILPLYVPSELEKKDATLYANNVQKAVADSLGAQVTKHTYEDAVLYRSALNMEEKKYKPKFFTPAPGDYTESLKALKVQDLKDMFDTTDDPDHRFKLTDAKNILSRFQSADTDGDGLIDIQEFASAVGYDPNCEQTRRIFSFFDKDMSGKIDMKELIISMTMCNPYSTAVEKVRFAFDIFDSNADGFVSQGELQAVLKRIGSLKFEKATKLQIDKLISLLSGQKQISWGKFKELVAFDSILVSAAISTLEYDKKNSDSEEIPLSEKTSDSEKDFDSKKKPKFFPFGLRKSSSQLET